MLGGWFESGQELSAGQWQKIAVSRGCMREAEVLASTNRQRASMLARSMSCFNGSRALAADRTAIVISHRFSTVRMADRIAVLHNGEMEELGSRRELIERNGRMRTSSGSRRKVIWTENQPGGGSIPPLGTVTCWKFSGSGCLICLSTASPMCRAA